MEQTRWPLALLLTLLEPQLHLSRPRGSLQKDKTLVPREGAVSPICSLPHQGAHSPGIETDFLGNFPEVCDHLVVVSVINGVVGDPELGHLNFRVTQFSMGNSCITQSVGRNRNGL